MINMIKKSPLLIIYSIIHHFVQFITTYYIVTSIINEAHPLLPLPAPPCSDTGDIRQARRVPVDQIPSILLQSNTQSPPGRPVSIFCCLL